MKPSLCIIGLGYVGLPLAYAFAKKGYEVSGFDVHEGRINALRDGIDATNELTSDQLKSVQIEYSADPSIIGKADIIIVALPTPVDTENKPDLSILEAGTKTVAAHMKDGAIVVYESTVYPGVTQDFCGNILKTSGKNFTLGYSPERINPGDKQHTVETIVKIVAGEDEKTADVLCELYGSIVSAGIHRASSIKVAEMAKAIENAQRDINIAYMNEVAMLCSKLGIETKDVLEAAKTKWNFLPFQPGLVGGHCIGVDPYYLVEIAKENGMNTQLITAGRSINDGMAKVIADEVLGSLAGSKKILVIGLTFKENVPDQRNSKSKDVCEQLQAAGADVRAHDPLLKEGEEHVKDSDYDAILLLVPHQSIVEQGTQWLINHTKEGGLVYDLKSVLDKKMIEESGRRYRSL